MSHEQSETVQDPKTGKYVNVYGRGTKKAGQRLPEDSSGVGHKEYDNVDDAVREAVQRSNSYTPHEHKENTPAGGLRSIESEQKDAQDY